MDQLINFLKKKSTIRIMILAILFFLLYLMRDMMNLFLLTFIMAYLMYRIQSFISSKISKFVKVGNRVVTICLYMIFVFLAILGIYNFLPLVIQESKDVIDQVISYYTQNEAAIEKYLLSALKKFNIDNLDISKYVGKGLDILAKSASSIGKLSFDMFIAIILSLFFLLERTRIARFTLKFKTSSISVFYNEIEYFGKKFINSFGKVIEAQFLIALINSILSTIVLSILGFDKVIGLGIMIFVLGLIPVAGVIISLVPLSLIAFNTGGVKTVLFVWGMIAVLHALEAYVLNPKLMSSKTELPVFYTFIILLIGEHFFKVWGLIIGIPVFMFILDLVEVKSNDPVTKKRIFKRTKKL
ncbi:AI-2E family transporter [Acetivibrio cellulolyticus]|uniref:AI-2E family transporter n=1 Tax=Acetivibrio cellulolyticus TaxID=35830 RepID=UPI0001E2D898|nr:AI-2E family transporter [Acetivibrio cellulolyticus]